MNASVVGTTFMASVVAMVHVSDFWERPVIGIHYIIGIDHCHDGRDKSGPYDDGHT